MAAPRIRPGNPDRGWNDPPMFNFNAQQPGAPRRLLNKRVAFPATNLPSPGHAVLNPSQGPPTNNPQVHDASAGIPIPKVIQASQVGNSALPPALQVVTTAVVDQDAPLSPVLLPPSADTSMPETVPLLVPTMVDQPGQRQDPAVVDEPLADMLSRLQLQDDGQLIGHVMSDFETVMDRYCKLLTEKACDDIRRKLELLEDKWKRGCLSEAVKVKITHLAAALLHEEVDKANHLHLALMVDHIAEVNQWMIGVKKLIQQQQLILKEKELISGNIYNSETENSSSDKSSEGSMGINFINRAQEQSENVIELAQENRLNKDSIEAVPQNNASDSAKDSVTTEVLELQNNASGSESLIDNSNSEAKADTQETSSVDCCDKSNSEEQSGTWN